MAYELVKRESKRWRGIKKDNRFAIDGISCASPPPAPRELSREVHFLSPLLRRVTELAAALKLTFPAEPSNLLAAQKRRQGTSRASSRRPPSVGGDALGTTEISQLI